MLSKRPSTFDRSESKSNGAARPWSTLLDLLLKWNIKNIGKVNQLTSVFFLSPNMKSCDGGFLFLLHTQQFITFQSARFHLTLANVSAHLTYAIEFQIVQFAKVVNMKPQRPMSLSRFIWTVSEKKRNKKKEFSSVLILVCWPSGGN